MDHNLAHDSPVVGSNAEVQGGHNSHMPKIFDDMSDRQETELLEMLHMPILHGGVNEVLLLSSLATDSASSFALACLVLVVCVTLLELLRLLAWWVENQYSGGGSMTAATCGCKQCNSLASSVGDRKHYDAIHDSSIRRGEAASPVDTTVTTQTSSSRWMIWACVGGLQFLVYLISIFLMLIAMTMNIYLIISMAVGSMIGKMTAVCVRKKLMEARK